MDCPKIFIQVFPVSISFLFPEIFSDLPEPKKGLLKTPHKMKKWMSDLEGKMGVLHSKVKDMQNNPVVHSHRTSRGLGSKGHIVKRVNASQRSEKSEAISDEVCAELMGKSHVCSVLALPVWLLLLHPPSLLDTLFFPSLSCPSLLFYSIPYPPPHPPPSILSLPLPCLLYCTPHHAKLFPLFLLLETVSEPGEKKRGVLKSTRKMRIWVNDLAGKMEALHDKVSTALCTAL